MVATIELVSTTADQGLDVARGECVCVLHNDLLIHNEGWLDHIVGFKDRRLDVGLVGLAGHYTFNEDGIYDVETTIVDMRVYPKRKVHTWRFTEVARARSPLDGRELMVLFDRGPGPWLREVKSHLAGLVLEGELEPDDKDGAAERAREFLERRGDPSS